MYLVDEVVSSLVCQPVIDSFFYPSAKWIASVSSVINMPPPGVRFICLYGKSRFSSRIKPELDKSPREVSRRRQRAINRFSCAFERTRTKWRWLRRLQLGSRRWRLRCSSENYRKWTTAREWKGEKKYVGKFSKCHLCLVSITIDQRK